MCVHVCMKEIAFGLSVYLSVHVLMCFFIVRWVQTETECICMRQLISVMPTGAFMSIMPSKALSKSLEKKKLHFLILFSFSLFLPLFLVLALSVSLSLFPFLSLSLFVSLFLCLSLSLPFRLSLSLSLFVSLEALHIA